MSLSEAFWLVAIAVSLCAIWVSLTVRAQAFRAALFESLDESYSKLIEVKVGLERLPQIVDGVFAKHGSLVGSAHDQVRDGLKNLSRVTSASLSEITNIKHDIRSSDLLLRRIFLVLAERADKIYERSIRQHQEFCDVREEFKRSPLQ